MAAEMSNPASEAQVVNPSDSADITFASPGSARGLWIGGAGNVNVIMEGDKNIPSGVAATSVAVLFSGVGAGTLLPIRVSRVLSTNTTATLIVALK